MRNEPLVERISGKDNGPEYLALATFAGRDEKRKAYAMQNAGGLRITCTTRIMTSKKSDEEIVLADYTTVNQVCDAHYVKSFSVKLNGAGSEGDSLRLSDAKITFEVDGEPLIKQAPFKDIFVRDEVLIPEQPLEKSTNFSAYPVERPLGPDPKVNKEKWLGYMICNGTQVRVILGNVPDGVGPVSIETSLVLVLYTTKTMNGSVAEV